MNKGEVAYPSALKWSSIIMLTVIINRGIENIPRVRLCALHSQLIFRNHCETDTILCTVRMRKWGVGRSVRGETDELGT